MAQMNDDGGGCGVEGVREVLPGKSKPVMPWIELCFGGGDGGGVNNDPPSAVMRGLGGIGRPQSYPRAELSAPPTTTINRGSKHSTTRPPHHSRNSHTQHSAAAVPSHLLMDLPPAMPRLAGTVEVSFW